MKTGKVCLFVILAVICLGFFTSCGQSPLMAVTDGNDQNGQQIPAESDNNLDIRFVDEDNTKIANMQFELVCINSPNIKYDQDSNHIAERDNGTVILMNIVNADYQINITDPNYLLIRIKKNINGHEEIVNKLTPCAEPGTEKYFIIVRAI